VIVKTDHKPLLGTVNKAIALCSPRIQRMRLLLQTYEFNLVYKPEKELYIADALSRAPEERQFVDDSSQFSDENVNMLVFFNSFSANIAREVHCSNLTGSDITSSVGVRSLWLARTSQDL
jgi:hypothetical protein